MAARRWRRGGDRTTTSPDSNFCFRPAQRLPHHPPPLTNPLNNTRQTNLPVQMMSSPTTPVAADTAANTVASVSAADTPASKHCCTTLLQMAERKMSPTSCTCPAPETTVHGGEWVGVGVSLLPRGQGKYHVLHLPCSIAGGCCGRGVRVGGCGGARKMLHCSVAASTCRSQCTCSTSIEGLGL